MHLYTISLLVFAVSSGYRDKLESTIVVRAGSLRLHLLDLIRGSSNFFIMSTPMLVAGPGIFFLISLLGFKVPFQVSSDPAGTRIKPGVFYLFEDIGAVDFRHGKPFRQMLHDRWGLFLQI